MRVIQIDAIDAEALRATLQHLARMFLRPSPSRPGAPSDFVGDDHPIPGPARPSIVR